MNGTVRKGAEMKTHGTRIGVIGCGRFAQFALEQFLRNSGTEVTAVTDIAESNARRAAEMFHAAIARDPDDLTSRPDIDLVYIATPPALHYPLAMLALEAGKHAIVEKPFALTLHQADEMIEYAHQKKRLIVANLMQRYNPNYDAIERLIRERLLGDLLHAYFENYAADEMLAEDHWFWDRRQSGGIFVEHGVHFFDLFEGWLGPGDVEAAQCAVRPGALIEDQVQCAIRYPGDILVHFYHGFHQPVQMDRQEMRLVFERGDVALEEWIPTRVRIHAIVDNPAYESLCSLWSDALGDVTISCDHATLACRGRHKRLNVSRKIDLTAGKRVAKTDRYRDMIRAFFADQLAWIRDSQHHRKVTEHNGRNSLLMAINADRLSHHCAAMSRTTCRHTVASNTRKIAAI